MSKNKRGGVDTLNIATQSEAQSVKGDLFTPKNIFNPLQSQSNKIEYSTHEHTSIIVDDRIIRFYIIRILLVLYGLIRIKKTKNTIFHILFNETDVEESARLFLRLQLHIGTHHGQ